MGEHEARDQTVASSGGVDAAVSRAADQLNRLVSGETKLGSLPTRRRRLLWAILSSLFFVVFVVCTFMVHSERNGALHAVAAQSRDEAQLVTATLTGKQFTKPVTGKSYEKLAAKVRRSASSRGFIQSVIVWSSHGRILFSLSKSQVGTTPPEMESLIVGIAQGFPLGTRVLDQTVQTFVPASKAGGGPVAVVEVDQPLAAVDARAGNFWSILRLVTVFGLLISLCFLGLTFVSPRSLAGASDEDGPTEQDGWLEDDKSEEMMAEVSPPAEEPPAQEPTRRLTYAEIFHGVQLVPNQESPAPAQEDEGSQAEGGEEISEESGEETEMEADGQPSAEEPPTDEPAPSPEEEEEKEEESAPQPDFDESVDQEQAVEADIASADVMQRRREELKARAEEAQLRIKKLGAEREKTPSGQGSGR
jgi:hypothetical protein